MDNIITHAYSGEQGGGDLPYFVGKQYGSGWLRTIARFAFPLLKRAVGVATNTAEDVVMRKKAFGKSLRDNAMSELTDAVGRVVPMNSGKRKHTSSHNNTANTIYAKKKRRRK